MSVGKRQVVEQDQTQAISIRLVEDGASLSLLPSGHTITIFGPSNNEIVPATGIGLAVDGSDDTILHYTATWTEATYTRRYSYRAEWSLNTGGGTFRRVSRFDVVRRIFRSQLIDQDVYNVYPYIKGQLPKGITTLKTWRDQAWSEIEREIRQRWGTHIDERSAQGSSYQGIRPRDIYPGDIFYPESFFEAHRELSAAFFFRGNAYDASPQGEDWARYNDCMQRGNAYLLQALANIDIDLDDDNVVDSREKGNYIGIRLER